ncbi:glutamine-dependent NAD(+) synthetase [Aspergillus fumigatus]|nr:glutamine-dependent NAD(+) synthetase [Aspergillus fumigatus]KAH1380327.1 glutamine-dependent NAD(+) synthetase [Aspergillus fumigatus]KAH1648622.1 glutamine-dependent NAD(+) synthetase [Aspergillus fumigatus]KAH1748692.1 glutamine-dependent NAD(+) synthetase [Aspergillus fumigatus]KAH2051956.1 glutamine-dependent NAD(+) synthetase [Aspergillus fumigatus]
MGHLVTLATCSLNQWALDFEGNAERIIESIRQAKAAGATLRVGPELEITGYGVLDGFLEGDTFLHSWEMLARIIDHPDCQDIVVDVGMPVRHRNVRYNCRVIFYNRKIILIRPKMWLANGILFSLAVIFLPTSVQLFTNHVAARSDGNYRELRHFSPWQRPREIEDYYLEQIVGKITGQYKVPFGDAVISTRDTCIGLETCEELFTPNGPHIPYGLAGVEIISNSSGSHHELKKLDTRVNLITQATKLSGGIYLYANQQGCDGDRLYYDGCAMIVINGNIVAQGSQFSLKDVEVITATVDIEEVRHPVRTYRASSSRNMQATRQPPFVRLDLDVRLSRLDDDAEPGLVPSEPISAKYHAPEEEISLGPACWLWDYLRRSGAAGFFLPLSGGIDSCATAIIVHSMCREVVKAVSEGNQQVIKDVRRLCAEPEGSTWLPRTSQEVCNRIFHTSFMGTQNSSKETRERAKALSTEIGSYHIDFNFDTVVTAITNLFTVITNFQPRFKVHGGTGAENAALQNVQARLRMVLSYLFASLLPTPTNSCLECLRGYLTKYDASSADLNPIGSISKVDLKKFIAWARDSFDLPILHDFLTATPTAELEPITATYVQSDEADMGVTYAELGTFGYLRKVAKLGPWSMYEKLLHVWGNEYSPREIYEKTRHFFYHYAINRHKMTVLTPSYHAEQYSPEDNRHDLRQFLYPPFTWAYKKMEESVKYWESKGWTAGKAQKKSVKAD